MASYNIYFSIFHKKKYKNIFLYIFSPTLFNLPALDGPKYQKVGFLGFWTGPNPAHYRPKVDRVYLKGRNSNEVLIVEKSSGAMRFASAFSTPFLAPSKPSLSPSPPPLPPSLFVDLSEATARDARIRPRSLAYDRALAMTRRNRRR